MVRKKKGVTLISVIFSMHGAEIHLCQREPHLQGLQELTAPAE